MCTQCRCQKMIDDLRKSHDALIDERADLLRQVDELSQWDKESADRTIRHMQEQINILIEKNKKLQEIVNWYVDGDMIT